MTRVCVCVRCFLRVLALISYRVPRRRAFETEWDVSEDHIHFGLVLVQLPQRFVGVCVLRLVQQGVEQLAPARGELLGAVNV